MSSHPPEYWQAVSQILEAESVKAAIYVKHAQSLGVAREKILSSIIAEETPEPLVVGTGAIFDESVPEQTSRQCDIITYDPTVATPRYSFDDFVIVEPQSALSVIECKSNLNEKEFGKTLDIWSSVRQFSTPVLGFAFDGVSIDSFTKYCQDSINGDAMNLPEFFCVHQKQYIGFRGGNENGENELVYHIADISKHPSEFKGSFGTALFLTWYGFTFDESPRSFNVAMQLYQSVGVPADALTTVLPNGKIHTGEYTPIRRGE